MDDCQISGILILLAYSILEFWLGKTGRTKASSLIELVIVGLTLMCTLILLRVRKKNGSNGNPEGNQGTN